MLLHFLMILFIRIIESRICYDCDSRDVDNEHRRLVGSICSDETFEPNERLFASCGEGSCIKYTVNLENGENFTKRFCNRLEMDMCFILRNEFIQEYNKDLFEPHFFYCDACNTDFCNGPTDSSHPEKLYCYESSCELKPEWHYHMFSVLMYFGVIITVIEGTFAICLLIAWIFYRLRINLCCGLTSRIRRGRVPKGDTPSSLTKREEHIKYKNMLLEQVQVTDNLHRSCSQLRAFNSGIFYLNGSQSNPNTPPIQQHHLSLPSTSSQFGLSSSSVRSSHPPINIKSQHRLSLETSSRHNSIDKVTVQKPYSVNFAT